MNGVLESSKFVVPIKKKLRKLKNYNFLNEI